MSNPRTALTAGAFAVLSVVALAGWTRKGISPIGSPIGLGTANGIQPISYDQMGQPIYVAPGTQPVSVNEPCLPASGGLGTSNPASYRTTGSVPAYEDDRYVSDQYVRSIHRPVRVVTQNFVSDPVRRNSLVREEDSREVTSYHAGRTKTKSALIVAGGAGTGAAIGAIAGGGKGAGIGAISGGAAGFIYDRLTHNRR